MNSRERVTNALTGNITDRIPADYSAHAAVTEALIAKTQVNGTEELLQFLGVDFRRIPAPYGQNQTQPDADGYFTDFWGMRKHRNSEGIIDETNFLFSEESTIEDIDAHAWPANITYDYTAAREQCRKIHDHVYTVGAPWSPFFHEAGWIVGQENFLIWMHTRPDLIEHIINHIVNVELIACQHFFDATKGYLDIAYFGNDFGTQRGLFISPELFSRFIRPALKKFYDLAHDYNLTVMQHSCGAISDIIPWLIEDGVNIIDPVQSSCCGMELEDLYKSFGSQISFHGGICTQSLLPFGSVEDVRQTVKKYRQITKAGGHYLLSGSQEYMSDIPVENILTIYETNKTLT
jgi:uroporphyrinogen decarboxylase